MSDDVSLISNGRAISGWTDVRIGAGVETCPRHFEVGYTELYPGDPDALIVKPGDSCQIKIGGDVVVTGYVDRVMPALSASQHEIRIQGRGKCEDLVDSTADYKESQISGANVLSLAQQLAAPHQITVMGTGPEIGPVIPPISLIGVESCWEIIERLCRWRALLAYEGPDGNLILSRVGTEKHASGFKQGSNVESATIAYSMDQRFHEYQGFQYTINGLKDVAGPSRHRSAFDQDVRKNRLKKFIVEAVAGSGDDVVQRRIDWECARRWGRGNALQVVTDSWRDSAGKLWTPNMLVPLDLPLLKVPTDAIWAITEVSFERSAEGTHAHLTVMPPKALLPQPPDPSPWQEVPAAPPSQPGAK